MGNKITRFTRRTLKIRKKKSKKNGGRKITEPECQCIMAPNTPATSTCMKCMSRLMQDITVSRSKEKHPTNNGNFKIIENSIAPICGAQFDAKKFDKIFKLNQDESESDDFQYDDELSDSFESAAAIVTQKQPEAMVDNDHHSENSYSSIFEVFEKLERNNLLTSVVLDEMFFYPGTAGLSGCDKISDKSTRTEEVQPDEIHLYDSVASCHEFDDIAQKKSKETSSRTDDFKKHKIMPFNATQFDAKQIDDSQFRGMWFNDSQFDAKHFDATEFDVIKYFVAQLNKSQNSSLKPDLAGSFQNSQTNASQFNKKPLSKDIEINKMKFEDTVYDTTENQCDDAKLTSALLNAEPSNVTEFQAALIRTAEYVNSHFAPPFRTTQFNGSQFDAKQFNVSKFPLTQFNTSQFHVSDSYPTRFTASQFDAKAFDIQKCTDFHKTRAESSRFDKTQKLNDDCFNFSQFDAKLFNSIQLDLMRIYAT